MNNIIRVSEMFHSIQGEGNTMGKPSVFLRLQSCNLACGNPQLKNLKRASQEEINQAQSEDATWTCDTFSVWLKGEKWETPKLAKYLANKYTQEFQSGTQLVITGGEPMLQQSQFPELVRGLKIYTKNNVRVEVETNGTILPMPHLETFLVDQFNISPKLANSGMSKERRIIPETMTWFSRLGGQDKAIFKFVITRPEDVDEMVEDYIKAFHLPERNVWLMPGCSNREQYEETAPFVAQVCKERGYQFSSRLQINLWNQVTGV